MIKNYLKILSYYKHRSFTLILFYSLLLVISEIISIALLFPLLLMIFNKEHEMVEFINGILLENNLIFINFFTTFATFLIIIYLLRFIINNFCYFKILDYRASIQKFFSNRALELFTFKSYLEFKEENSNQFSVGVSRETEKFSAAVDALVKVFIDTLIIFLIIVILLYQNFIFSLYLIVFSLVIFISIRLIFRPFLKKWGLDHVRHDVSRMTTLNEVFNLIREIKIFNKVKLFIKKFSFDNSRTQIAQRNRIFLANLMRSLLEFIIAISIIFTFIFLNTNSESLLDHLATISFFFIALLRIMPSFLRILTSLQSLIFAKNAVDLHLSIIKNFEKIKKEKNKKKYFKSGKFKFKKKNSLKFNKVSFFYKKLKILENVSAQFYDSSIIGIKGDSGSGKTTLVEIILTLLKPTKGKILFNNTNIHTNTFEWRNMASYVSQDNNLLHANILENIAFDFEKENINEIDIKNLLKNMNYNFYKKFSNRLKKTINYNARNLSIGEKQRISIARGLYKGRKIIIFDEVTSALDLKNENQILKEIKKFKKNKIIFIISHKKSSLKICDQIYEIDNLKLKKVL